MGATLLDSFEPSCLILAICIQKLTPALRLKFAQMTYVAYHNVERMDCPLRDGPPYSMMSRKAVKHLTGHVVWIVEGVGRKKQYKLRHRFLVDGVDELDDDYFRYEFYGATGANFSPGIEIPADAWRKDFLKSVGNFGIGVAKLQPEFEARFNQLAGIGSEVDDDKSDGFEYTEGEICKTIASYRSRSHDARNACIAARGSTCLVCGFDFGRMYGEKCEGFIEVHHITQLAKSNGLHRVDPKLDLVPICPNCHRAIHLLNCTVDELSKVVRQMQHGK